MNIRTRHYHDVAILSLHGRFDAASSPHFAQAVDEQIAAGYMRMVIDLKRVDFLTSMGIKGMIRAVQQTRQRGGDFRIANARAQVKFVLNLAGVDSVIKQYPNVVGATASYFPGPLPDVRG